jgi:hypothetical protein
MPKPPFSICSEHRLKLESLITEGKETAERTQQIS